MTVTAVPESPTAARNLDGVIVIMFWILVELMFFVFSKGEMSDQMQLL